MYRENERERERENGSSYPERSGRANLFEEDNQKCYEVTLSLLFLIIRYFRLRIMVHKYGGILHNYNNEFVELKFVA